MVRTVQTARSVSHPASRNPVSSTTSTTTTTTTTTSSSAPTPIPPVAVSSAVETYGEADRADQIISSSTLSGYKFYLAGTFQHWKHGQISRLIASHGGQTISTLNTYSHSANTLAIVSQSAWSHRSTNPSSKVRKVMRSSAKAVKLDYIVHCITAGRMLSTTAYEWTGLNSSSSSSRSSHQSTSQPAAKRARLNPITTLDGVKPILKELNDLLAAKNYSKLLAYSSSKTALIRLDMTVSTHRESIAEYYTILSLAYQYQGSSMYLHENLRKSDFYCNEAMKLCHTLALPYFIRGKNKYLMGEYQEAKRDLGTYCSMESDGKYTEESSKLISRCEAMLLASEFVKLTADSIWCQKYISYAKSIDSSSVSAETIREHLFSLYLDYHSQQLLKGAELAGKNSEDTIENLSKRLNVAYENKKSEEEEVQIEATEKTENGGGFTGYCPVTGDRIHAPMRSKCNHIFDREGIYYLIGTKQSTKCPVAGCNQVISSSDLVYDPVLAKKLSTMTFDEDDDDDTTKTLLDSSSNNAASTAPSSIPRTHIVDAELGMRVQDDGVIVLD